MFRFTMHNFFHRRDNFRMVYFNFSLMSYRELRISHALSHHMYPNSLHDMQLFLLEPFICYIPNKNMKGKVRRYASWIYEPVMWGLLFIGEIFKRLFECIVLRQHLFSVSDLVPYSLPCICWVAVNFGRYLSYGR